MEEMVQPPSHFQQEFMVFSDTTTSLSPASMETIDAGGLRGGYPAWIINEMIKLDIDPEAKIGHPCGYHLVMTYSSPWKITMLLIGKPR